MSKLQNKVVIVVVSNAGIGRAAAQLFAREGASVAVAARREEEGRAVAESIVAEGGQADEVAAAALYFASDEFSFTTGTGLVLVSGQVAWNHQCETTETSLEGQARKPFDNLQIALTAGSSVEELLQVPVYIRGELGAHMATVGPILAGFLGESRPAVTGIGVASLASPAILVEVEAVATVAKGL